MKKISKNRLSFFLVMILSFACVKAQDDEGQKDVSDKVTVRPAPFSLRAEFAVPSPIPKAWRISMVGVAEANLSFNVKVYKGLFIGAGYKGSLFYVPKKFTYYLDGKFLPTKMQMHDAFLKVGYDFYQNNKYFITPGINFGYCFTKYTSLAPIKAVIDYKPQYTSWFLEPQVAFNFLPDPRFGICFHVSYVLVDHVWDPNYIAFQDWIPEVSHVSRTSLTSYFNFGFGIYAGIGNGKKKAGKQ